MKKLLLKIINILLILVAIGLGFWLVNKNFPATGQLEVNAILGQDKPAISGLGPPPRVKMVDGYQLILDSPVYFDLRVPRWWNQARIELIYQEVDRQLIELAGKVGPEWQYDPKKPVITIDLGDGFKQAIFEFDLNTLYQKKNIRRFLISTAGELRDEIKIKSIKVILNR